MKTEIDVTVTFTQEEINEIINDRLIEDRMIDQDFELYATTKLREGIVYMFRKIKS
jgi:hypothetical protein